MGDFCVNCGSPLTPGVRFCKYCGQAVEASAPNRQQEQQRELPRDPGQYQAPPQRMMYGGGAVREGIPAPGFSDRVNDPEILAAMKKQRGAAKISAIFIVPVPFIGFVLYSMITGNMETGQAVKAGLFVSAVFLAFALWSFIHERPENTYEGVVLSQDTELSRNTKRDSSGNRTGYREYNYITRIQTTDGKQKKIVETDHGRRLAFEYLQPGDRIKYHPQFAFPYELYDKSRADGIYCVGCQKKNPVTADRCSRCNLPLLK
ncbi:MAG: zinc ribbon domain-containing protein [Clostridium sp.]|nr:zinc ribbon domain-containing protein [Clostridium sp.]MBO6150647.1 zinc ribbon domain-containing protein [Clostridium sp.]